VLDLIAAGVVPGGTWTNVEFIEPFVSWADGVDPHTRVALADAQTSGGLLIAVPPSRADALVQALVAGGTHSAAVIGELIDGVPGAIEVEA
jgi:selenide,water dikinase